MDANLLNFLISFSSGLGANLTTSAISSVYQRVFSQRPDLENRLTHPKSSEDFESALRDVAGVVEALAGNGSISIDGSFINALRSARFDHQSGYISIGNSLIAAPFLEIGGTGPSGRTHIQGNTQLRGGGAGILVGEGAGIVITGGAGIKIG